jgi:hypothetical protein
MRDIQVDRFRMRYRWRSHEDRCCDCHYLEWLLPHTVLFVLESIVATFFWTVGVSIRSGKPAVRLHA